MDYFQLMRNKHFMYLWISQILSSFGTWLYNIALLIYITSEFESGTIVSGVMIAGMIPYILIGSLVGYYVDRMRRKKIMIVSDLIRFLLISVLTILVNVLSGLSMIAAILVITLLHSVAGSFFDPARKAFMPLIVPEDQMKSANSLMHISGSLTLILGPAVGSLVVSFLGVNGFFFINAVSFLISAGGILFIKIKEKTRPSHAADRASVFKNYVSGWKLIHNDRSLSFYVYTGAVRALVVGFINVSFVFAAKHLFANGEQSVGFLYSSLGLGIILGSIIVGFIKSKINEKEIYLFAIFINAMCSVFYIKTDLWYIALISLFAAGLSDGFQMVIFHTRIQTEVPNMDLGKVFSSSQALTMVIQLLSMAAGGVLYDAVDYANVVQTASILVITLSLGLYVRKQSKTLTG